MWILQSYNEPIDFGEMQDMPYSGWALLIDCRRLAWIDREPYPDEEIPSREKLLELVA